MSERVEPIEVNGNSLEQFATYTPTEWKSGDVVTSKKLNKIEEGLALTQTIIVPISSREIQIDGDDPLVITSLQHPAQDFINAFAQGINILIDMRKEGDPSAALLRLISVGSYNNRDITFACAAPFPGMPTIYWYAPEPGDALMIFGQQTQQYINQFYGRTINPSE